MIRTNEKVVSADTLTTAKPQKTGQVFTTIISQVEQGGQCDCDAGIVWMYGNAQPCHKCRDGQRMAECQEASYMMEWGR